MQDFSALEGKSLAELREIGRALGMGNVMLKKKELLEQIKSVAMTAPDTADRPAEVAETPVSAEVPKRRGRRPRMAGVRVEGRTAGQPSEQQPQEPAPVVPNPTEPTVCPEQEPAPSAAPVIEKTENIEEEPQTPAEETSPTAKANLTVPTTTPAEELPQENAAEPTPQPQENAPQTDVSAPAKPSAEPATQPAMAEEPAPIAPEAVLPASTDEN